jgi:hypothetical protein
MLAKRDHLLHCITLPKHGFSCRLHVGGIAKGKVYFEYIIETNPKDAGPQIGIASHDWQPPSDGDGVGDDDKSVGIDGQRCKIWTEGMDNIEVPAWKVGTCVGVHIDMNSSELSFSYDGVEVASKICIKSLERAVVPAFFCRYLKFGLNFGQAPLQHKPSDYISLLEYSKSFKPHFLEFFNKDTKVWTPIAAKDRFFEEYLYDWQDAVRDDSNASVIDNVLKRCDLATVTELADACDTQGRRVMDVAAVVNRDELRSYIYFLGRYAFKSLRPEHKSDTCVVMIA